MNRHRPEPAKFFLRASSRPATGRMPVPVLEQSRDIEVRQRRPASSTKPGCPQERSAVLFLEGRDRQIGPRRGRRRARSATLPKPSLRDQEDVGEPSDHPPHLALRRARLALDRRGRPVPRDGAHSGTRGGRPYFFGVPGGLAGGGGLVPGAFGTLRSPFMRSGGRSARVPVGGFFIGPVILSSALCLLRSKAPQRAMRWAHSRRKEMLSMVLWPRPVALTEAAASGQPRSCDHAYSPASEWFDHHAESLGAWGCRCSRSRCYHSKAPCL